MRVFNNSVECVILPHFKYSKILVQFVVPVCFAANSVYTKDNELLITCPEN